jgi:hypothetical protein
MFRFLFLIVAFYIIYNGIKLFLKYFIPAVKSNKNVKDVQPRRSKINRDDIEEADFIEIKSDTKTEKD